VKKVLTITMVVALVVILAVAVPLATTYQTTNQPVQATSTSISHTKEAIPLSHAAIDIVPVSATPTSFAVTTSYIPPGASNPGTEIFNPVYTETGKQIYMSKETGLLVTKDGRAVMDKATSAITKFDMETQEFTNGANQKLQVFFNSFLDRHYLRSGGGYVTEINLNREVFLINLKVGSERRAIYAFREKVEHGWSIVYKPGKWFNDEYRYYDMNGRLIDNQHIAEWDTASFARAMTGNVIFFAITGGIGFFGQLIFGNADNFGVPFVKVLDRTTLANLLEELKHATIHPYDTVEGIVTEDGQPIYIRPTTKQAVDRFNYPMFSVENGLPVLLYDEILVTSNLQGVPVQNGILKGVVSVTQLLESGTDFYMGTIPTPFGNMDAVVFNFSNDVKSPDWRLPNGESADGIIKDMELGRSLDGESWGSLFDRLFGGNGGLNIFQWIMIALAIIFVVFVLVIVFKILSFVPSKPKHRRGGY